MSSKIFIDKLSNYAIVFSTILLYFTSRIDANVFKVIFVLFFVMVMFRKLKKEFTINKNVIYFALFVLFNIAFYPIIFLANILTLGYFLIIFSLYYYYILRNNIFHLVNVYINFAFLMSLIGLIQEVLFLISPDYLFYLSEGKNPDFLYGQSFDILRIASLLDEPSKLGLYILPAILFGIAKYLYNINSIKISKLTFIVLLLAVILTFSAHVFLSLIFTLFFVFNINLPRVKYVKSIFYLMFFVSLPFLLSLDVVSEKVLNIGFFEQEFNSQSSTAATSSFFYVGISSIVDIIQNLNLFGFGMGNYNLLAQNYWNELGITNKNDDGSTIGYARIIVEFGIVGFILFFYFLYKTKIKINTYYMNEDIKFLVIINYVCLLFIISDLFRMGFYINPVIIFFVALFIVSKSKYKLYITQEVIK